MSNEASLIAYISAYSISAFLLSNKFKNERVAAFLGLLIPILFAGCRFKVGTDFWQYMNNFVRWDQISYLQLLRDNSAIILYKFTAKLSYGIGGRVLTWSVFAALVLIPVYKAVKEEYEDAFLGISMIVFFLTAFTSAFNLSKQYIAVAIVFWASKYIFEDKFLKFFFWVCVATLFHETALIAVVMWFFWDHTNHTSIYGYKRAGMLIAAVFVVVFYREMIIFLSSHYGLFEDFANYAVDKAANNRDFYVSILKLSIVLLLTSRLRYCDERNAFFINMLILTTIIGVTGFSHPQVKRIAYYFSVPAETILMGYIPYCFRSEQKDIVGGMVIVFYMALFTLTYYILGQSHILPYIFDVTTPWG